MTDEQDDLTLVYAYGFKRGQDSMKAEIERLRDDNIALRELRAELILRALDESAAEIERLRAALEVEIVAAYKRGANWAFENGVSSADYLPKAAYDYADSRAALAGETLDDAAP